MTPTFPYNLGKTILYKYIHIFLEMIFIFQIQRSVYTKDTTIAKLPMNWEEQNLKLLISVPTLQLLTIIKPYPNLTYNQKLKFVNLAKTISFYVMQLEFPDQEQVRKKVLKTASDRILPQSLIIFYRMVIQWRHH